MTTSERIKLLKLIEKGKVTIKNLDPELFSDFSILVEIFKKNPKDFGNANSELKSNEKIVELLLDENIGDIFEFVDDNIKSNNELCLKAIKLKARNYNLVDEKFKLDLKFNKEAIYLNPQLIHYCEDQRIINDFEIIKMVVSKGYCTYRSIPEKLKLNKELFFITINGITGCDDFEYTPDEMRHDKDLIFEIIKSSTGDISNVMKYASDELKNDLELASLICQRSGHLLYYFSDELKNNEDLVKICMLSNVGSFEYASESLRSNEKFALEFVKANLSPSNFKFVGAELLKNKKFALEVFKVQNECSIFQYLNE